jgi:hypothetical protein
MDILNKKKIAKNLSQDRESIRSARSIAAKKPGFDRLDPSEQERQLEQAAMSKIQRRIDEGMYVSCNYPEFEGYIPPITYGKTGHTKDPVRETCYSRQLEALRRGPDSDDDDDENPLPIKTEDDIKQRKMSEFLQFVGTQEARLSKDSSEHGHEDSGNKNPTANPRSKGRSTTVHTLKRTTKVDKSHYKNNNNNKKEAITWRAVSRGQPLLPGSPAPSFKHWKPNHNPWLGRVVFRGQIMAEDGKGED